MEHDKCKTEEKNIASVYLLRVNFEIEKNVNF